MSFWNSDFLGLLGLNNTTLKKNLFSDQFTHIL